MSIFKEFGEKLALENERVLFEFDLGNFLRSASLSLNKDTKISDMNKIHTYSSILKGTIEDLKNIKFDKNENSLKDLVIKASRTSVYSKALNTDTKIIINPSIVNEYIKFIDEKLVNCANGNDSYNPTNFIDMIDKIKSQSVRVVGGDIINNSPKSIIRSIVGKKEELITPLYIKSVLLPFIQTYESSKSNLIKEAEELLFAVEKAENGVTNTISRIDMMCNGESISSDMKKSLRKLSYMSLRSLIEITSYVSSMMIKKIDIFNSNVIACNEIFMKFNTGEIIESVTESTLDTVIDLSTGNVSKDFIDGQVGAFKDIATKVYEFHTGMTRDPDAPTKIGDDYADSTGEFSGGYIKYDKTPYDEGFRVFTMIDQSLDLIAGKTDDYLQLSTQMPEKEGFNLPLEQKFARSIEEITDLSKYSSDTALRQDGSFNAGLYRSMLNEVKDYPENMQKLANLAKATNIRIESLIDRFNNRINGEFKNAESTEELKAWSVDFKEEFSKFCIKISLAYFTRLKRIALELMNMVNSANSNGNSPRFPDSVPIDSIDVTDYTESVYDMLNSLEEESNKEFIQTLERAYYREREYKNRGKILVFEADTPANGQKPSTTPKVIDNSGEGSQSGGAMIKKIIARAQEWFGKLVETFNSNMKKLLGHKDAKWVIQNQQYLTTRSYNNVTIESLPYDNISPDTIISDLNSCANAIRGLTPQYIQGVKTKNELYSKIFPFMKGGQINPEQPFGEQVKNYYKCGSYTLAATKQISNGALKTYVTSTMLPFIVNFDGQYSPKLTSESDGVKKALSEFLTKLDTVGPQNVPSVTPTNVNTTTNTVTTTAGTTQTTTPVAASYIDNVSGYIAFEAEANKNTEASMSEKSKWVCELVQLFTGSICNAVRDREKDYIRILVQLCPKQDQMKAPTQQPVQQQQEVIPEPQAEQPTT